jgi:hypothetical protein
MIKAIVKIVDRHIQDGEEISCELTTSGEFEVTESGCKIVYNETDGVLAPEFREGAGMKDDAAALLQLYLSGPQDSTLRSPFPAGLRIITVNRTGKTLYLTLSHDLANLSGLELTVACASLTKTCMALTGVSAVQIRAQGGALLDGAGYIYMDESNLLLLDSGGQKK